MPIPPDFNEYGVDIYPNEYHLDELDVLESKRYSSFKESKYFRINKIPEVLTYGKHYFTISFLDLKENKNYLKQGSSILFEFKDRNDTVIFSDTTDIEDINGSAVCYVWLKEDPLRTTEDLKNGLGTFTIVGELDNVPNKWKGKYNYKETYYVDIRTDLPNISPILFKDQFTIQKRFCQNAIPDFNCPPHNKGLRNTNAFDRDSTTYKRNYFQVSASGLDTYGGKVDKMELSYRESSSRAEDYTVLTIYDFNSLTQSIYPESITTESARGLNPLSDQQRFEIPHHIRFNKDIFFKLRFLNASGEYATDIITGKPFEVSSSLTQIQNTAYVVSASNIYTSNLTVDGDITANRFITSASVVHTSSGSNIFGNSADDSHVFSGSVSSSGDMYVNGNFVNNGALGMTMKRGDIFFNNAGTGIWGYKAGDGNYSGLIRNHAGGYTLVGNTDVKTHIDGNNIEIDSNMKAFQSASFGGSNSSSAAITVKGDISSSGDIHLHNDKGINTQLSTGQPKNLINCNTTNNIIIGSSGMNTTTIYGKDSTYLHISKSMVGIGTTAQSDALLTVAGDISSSGDIYLKAGNDLRWYNSGDNDSDTRILENSNDLYVYSAGNMIYRAGMMGAVSSNADIKWEIPNGAEKMRYDGGLDAFGIGTTTPQKKLTVHGDISSSGHVYLKQGKRIHWESGSTPSSYNVGLTSTAGAFVVFSGSLGRHMLHSIGTGNVGINTLSAPEPLTVKGNISASGHLYLPNNGDINFARHNESSDSFNIRGNIGGIFIQSGAGDYTIAKFDVQAGEIDKARVSIGTTAAANKTLTVEGDISASGNIYAGPNATPIISSSGDIYIGNGEHIRNVENPNVRMLWSNTAVQFEAPSTSTFLGNEEQSNFDFKWFGENDVELFRIDTSADKVGIGQDNPSHKLSVDGDISASGALYGKVGTGLIISSSATDTNIFSVNHPISGTVFQVSAQQDSGSMLLSGSLELKSNTQKPSDSGSRLYNYNGNLEFNGIPIAPSHYEQIHGSFFDDPGTGKIYLPIRDTDEQTYAYQDEIARLAPCSGSLVSISMKIPNITANATYTFNLERNSPGTIYTSFTTIDTQTIDVTNGTDEYNVITVRFDNDATIAPGDLYAISFQSNTDSSSNVYWYWNAVFNWDYSTIPNNDQILG